MGFRLALAAATVAALVAPVTGTVPSAESPRVASSMVSARQVAGWDASRWSQEFRDLQAAGVSELVLDAAAFQTGQSVETYYPTSLVGTVQATTASGAPVDVLGPLLSGARSAGMKVWLGTYMPDASWYVPSDSTVDAMTSANASLTAGVLKDLDTRYRAFADVIAGWYLSSEVSAAYPWSSRSATALVRYYSGLVSVAHAASTTSRTMVSPYYNVEALPDPTLWTSMWTGVLEAAPLDVIALQVGTGDGGIWRTAATEASQIRLKYSATRQAITASAARTSLWANLDFYDVFGAFKPIGDVARDAGIAARYVSGYTSWSFTADYSPWTVGSDAYAKPFGLWNVTGRLMAGTPTTPTLVSSNMVGGQYLYSWTPATASTGTTIAYYRVFSRTGLGLGDAFEPTWTSHSSCITVQAVDTTGSVSPAMATC